VQDSSITVGRRISSTRWGAGRIFAIDKLNEIVYVEWDTPWANPNSEQPARKRAHHRKFIATWCEVDSGDPEAV
jgi:hypothetical protein